MVNKKLIKNFDKMNFKTDSIYVVIKDTTNKTLYEQPINSLRIKNNKNYWSLFANKTIFKDCEIKDPFCAKIVNRTVDNTVIAVTEPQQSSMDHSTDIEIHWNNTSGIIELKKV